MDRESALAKLQELRPRGVTEGIRTQGTTRRGPGGSVDRRPTFGVGLTRGASSNDYRIAVRVQDESLLGGPRIAAVIESAGGEVDVEYVGLPVPFAVSAAPNPTARVRPLVPGCSISTVTHDSAGTLGCLVSDDDGIYALSNSHVLTDHGTTPPGVAVVQPGRFDGGDGNVDVVGTLDRSVLVDPKLANVADCALAVVVAEVEQDVPGIGRPSSEARDLDIGDAVCKRGRTTGVTHGEVSSTNVNLKFEGWPQGPIEFVDLVEIVAPIGTAVPFAQPGDSGALVLRVSGLHPGALLVGGSVVAGQLRVYATPMTVVLRELGVELL